MRARPARWDGRAPCTAPSPPPGRRRRHPPPPATVRGPASRDSPCASCLGALARPAAGRRRPPARNRTRRGAGTGTDAAQASISCERRTSARRRAFRAASALARPSTSARLPERVPQPGTPHDRSPLARRQAPQGAEVALPRLAVDRLLQRRRAARGEHLPVQHVLRAAAHHAPHLVPDAALDRSQEVGPERRAARRLEPRQPTNRVQQHFLHQVARVGRAPRPARKPPARPAPQPREPPREQRTGRRTVPATRPRQELCRPRRRRRLGRPAPRVASSVVSRHLPPACPFTGGGRHLGGAMGLPPTAPVLRERRRERGQELKRKELIRRPRNTKTVVIEPVLRTVPVAIRRTEVPPADEPGTATQHSPTAVTTARPRGPVTRGAVVVTVPAILHPFPDVAGHVVQPETVRGERPDRRRLPPAVGGTRTVGILGPILDAVAPEPGCRRPGPRGVLPLRLARQPIALARLPAQPAVFG